MAQLAHLSIQGIRNYGPDHPRRIQFFTPITLILGQNGCGKTTIIESLKYISTGEVPPCGAHGASFVHDPKMSDTKTVRGQIKLKFSDTKKKQLTVTRSLEVTTRGKKLQCKTLDAVMSKPGVDGGDPVTLTSKCSDFEAMMTSCLGVSKPILTNVIFCHQEDSNWPLDEGKKVKDKFDAIFSATKYIKCLETIKKQREEMKKKVKNLKDLLLELKKWKDEASNKRHNLQKAQEQKTKCCEEKTKLTEEMKPIMERLKKLQAVENNIATVMGDIGAKEQLLGSVRRSQAELRETLVEEITCSDQELQRMIQDFHANLTRQDKELKKVVSEIRDVESVSQRRQREIAAAERQQGELDALHNNHMNNIVKRNTKITRLVTNYDIPDFKDGSEFSDHDAEAVLTLLKELMEEERTATQNRKRQFEQEEGKLQTEIDELRSREAALEHDIKTRGVRAEELSRKMKAAKQSLLRNENALADANMDEINTNLAQVEIKITEEEKKCNIQKMNGEIDNGKRKKQDIEHRVTDMKRTVAKMNRQAEARSQYDIHLKEKKELENKVEFLKRKDADELEHLLGEIPGENIKNKLEACTINIRRMISEARGDLERLNKRKAQLDTTIKNHKNQVNKKETEIRELDGKIESYCQGSDLDSALDKSKDMKEKLTRERGDLSSSITVLKGFTDKLKQVDCCPLCHRGFDRKDEVLQLIEELEGKVSSVPGRLDSVKHRLRDEESKHEQMIQLKPQRDQANRARQELDKIKSQLEVDTSELQKIGLDLESKQEMMDITLSDEETARRIQPDMITLDNNLKTIRRLAEQVEELQATLGTHDGEMSLDEAVGRQSELEEDHRRASENVEELQNRLQEHKDRLQTLKERKNKLYTDQLNLKAKIQETEKLKDEMIELEKSKKEVEEGREKSREEVAPYKYKLKQKTDEKTNITKDKEAYIDTQNVKIGEISENHRSVQELHRAIVKYVSGGGEGKLRESRQKVEELQGQVRELQVQRKTLDERNRKIEKEITSQKERKRNLDDEKKIREKEVEATSLRSAIAKLEEKVKEFDQNTLVQEKNDLNEKGFATQNKKAALDGRLEEMNANIRELETTLLRKDYRNAEKNYLDKFINMKCLDMSSDDLNKYYKALDTSIMRFHRDRMEHINRIIRELWKLTYKGNDIDYVEIQTDETESLGADRRRTYNYRVVMVKNKAEMDMRGRCSAGQKVLACLIIRLALAETFSADCGIFALDEPTTNLDRENIDALADALTNIIRSKTEQKNFQLVVITHDRDFLTKMTRCAYIDYYYYISRDNSGLSQITQKSVAMI